ncbi:hypothetical protein BLNAU_8845 [Blattamonas nauphoetae]|uniref:Ubiquitin-like domain-containing protein n=1 Tax=Blattamonas nauphoetae TaxID=2049346 RepID=A0ABQ9XXR5_9EUKA|nr:hypothetical protein BLNAU_8845 [Blattamonas nauphoetae]
MKLRIKTADSDETEIQGDPAETVVDLKHKISQAKQIPTPHLTLLFRGRILSDSLQLEECGLKDNSIIMLRIYDPEGKFELQNAREIDNDPVEEEEVIAVQPAPLHPPVAAPWQISNNPDGYRLGNEGNVGQGDQQAGQEPNLVDLRREMLRNVLDNQQVAGLLAGMPDGQDIPQNHVRQQNDIPQNAQVNWFVGQQPPLNEQGQMPPRLFDQQNRYYILRGQEVDIYVPQEDKTHLDFLIESTQVNTIRAIEMYYAHGRDVNNAITSLI